jgi:hypothetical protein
MEAGERVTTITTITTVAAVEDASLRARVVRRVELRYAGGADAALDRPAHVRAGSGLAWVGRRLAVVQDDASFLALVDPATGAADAVPLPAGPGGARQFDTARGTKHLKLDLEACVVVPGAVAGEPAGGGVLLGFGSGSTPRRERVLVAPLAGGGVDADAVRLHDASALYAALRASADFAGAELNVEGAALVGTRLRLLGRGNGAARDGLAAVSATCDLDAAALLAFLLRGDPAPAPRDVVRYDLGALGGAPLAFTDAAPLPDGSLVYTAAAEASPNAVDDGAVAGSAVGLLARGGAARWAALADAAGRPVAEKAEGVALAAADGSRLYVVFDVDDPGRPAELAEVELGGAR